MSEARKPRPWWRLGLLVAVLAGLFLLVRASPLGELDSLQDWLELAQRLGEIPGAPFLYLASVAALSVCGIPVTALLVGGGAVFGWAAVPLAYVGVLASATVIFALCRGLGEPAVARLLGRRYASLKLGADNLGFWALVRIRFLPVPYLLLTAAMALSGVSWRRYIVCTAVAFALAIPIFVYPGIAVRTLGDTSLAVAGRNLLLATFGLLAFTFLPERLDAMLRERRRKRQVEGM